DGIERSNEAWNAIPVKGGQLFDWDDSSTYIQEPPFFIDMPEHPTGIAPIRGARALVKVGDSVTTDHISPAGSIALNSPAGKFLVEHGVTKADFNSYGSRRGNDRVMTRGTFANIRLKNQLASGTEGGVTTDFTTGEVASIYDASRNYIAMGIPTVVLAGNDYGMGSSRDWAAKGTYLLGVKAVIAKSYERIHRSNLVGMGVLPLQFLDGQDPDTLGLDGSETFDIGIDESVAPRARLKVTATKADGRRVELEVACRLDTPVEVEYYRNGGILHTVLRNLHRSATRATA
ncbi:MAG TPA: aconitate hydratase, partial [Trueperaceae bacterium]|nr:aconitate hydratase [Trueperaceae bacterium]